MYLTKQDKEPYVWEEYTKDQIINETKASWNHKKNDNEKHCII